VLILILLWQKLINRIGFSPTELPMPIVAIVMLIAMHLYRRGLISIDKIKALYNKIETLLNKIKKFTKNCFAKIDTNLEVYILETV